MQQIDQYLTTHADRFVEELKAFLRIRSVSADSTLRSEVRQGAEFVRQQMESAGLTAELVETAGHPIVYGEWLGANGAPTVLIYGHYDVQPPDPLSEWVTPPFEPTVRDGCLYARGATDDKGQVFTHLKSIEAWMKTAGRLPVNVKFVIEGEEEVGSNNLDLFLERGKTRLKADVAVISDTSQFAPDVPAITCGLRGIVACEVTLRGPNQDLHSGVFGGALANPVNALARVLAGLHDDQGRVQIPGFYDDIPPLSAEERRQFAALPFDESAFFRSLGISAGWGEPGWTTLERRWARPTCDVNGIKGGYQGEGPKTIIPAFATAKITCRLVPRQDPEKIAAALEARMRALLPMGTRLEFKTWHGCPGFVFDASSPFMEAAQKAIRTAFGVAPVLIREGGSIPVVASFRTLLGLDTLLLGWGQNTDNLHSPNEHFHLADFHRGTRASAHLWQELALSRK
ncbi:MAG TPA: dipeptidase [Planctomycetaceae bacterium]|jgi:acetylornithine deacetylase/succinyl-diaminopimelate desuccinylase-like protein|nr:dipeptidase [Planctomycetaceae bacterium]